VGLLQSTSSGPTDIIALLRQTLGWQPTPVPEDDGQRISAIEKELVDLRERRRERQRQIEGAEQFARRADGFEGEATEQRDRLSSIKALPYNQTTEVWQWPFIEANLGMATPIAQALLSELESLDRELTAVTGERPALEAYLAEQQRDVASIGEQLRSKELELASAISVSEMVTQMGSRNNPASRVVGRVSLFLESLAPDAELTKLTNEERRLKGRVADIERRLGTDDSDARLASTVSNIAMYMSKYINDLGGEFGQYPARLDMHNLTVVIDRPGRPVYMTKTGGGENHPVH
jgi:hypothetical protein